MNNGRKEYTINWFIENYSYSWHENADKLVSPEITADGLEGTIWTLQLYPRGNIDETKGNISLYLNRHAVDDGPEDFPLKGELSFLAADGSCLLSENITRTMKRGIGRGYRKFVVRNDVHFRRKTVYLPDDILSVRCKIWKGEGSIQHVEQITARTRIGIEQISFIQVAESFSTLEPNQKRTIQIRTSKQVDTFSSSLYFTDGLCCEEKIVVEITPSSVDQILSKCKISLLDGSGKLIECGMADNRSYDTRVEIRKVVLSLTRKEILNRKGEYLPNDKLSVICECVFSTGSIDYGKIERTLHDIPFVALNQISNNDNNRDVYEEKLSECRNALDDLKDIYSNKLFTDVELKTKTKSFRAHKNLLCARSSVFNAMLTNNMKEKNTDSVEINDMENDIVEQLLLFLYSDKLENPQWDSVIKLYYAADKYAVEKLILLCSSFLIQNVTITSASELLLLADTHNDSDLKKHVEDFILKHDEQVFSSKEWENLTETNSLLVSKTMLLKYKRKI